MTAKNCWLTGYKCPHVGTHRLHLYFLTFSCGMATNLSPLLQQSCVGHYYCITTIHFTTTVVLVLLSLLLYCCSIIVPLWSSLSRSNPIDVSRQIFHVTFLPIMSSIKQLNTCCFQAITPVKSSILGPITKDYDGILFTIIVSCHIILIFKFGYN